MGDGLLCAGTRHGPALSSTERSLPSSRRWLEEASGFLPLTPQGPRRANPSKEQSNIPFVLEENAWDLVDETCAQGRAPALGQQRALASCRRPPGGRGRQDHFSAASQASGRVHLARIHPPAPHLEDQRTCATSPLLLRTNLGPSRRAQGRPARGFSVGSCSL